MNVGKVYLPRYLVDLNSTFFNLCMSVSQSVLPMQWVISAQNTDYLRPVLPSNYSNTATAQSLGGFVYAFQSVAHGSNPKTHHQWICKFKEFPTSFKLSWLEISEWYLKTIFSKQIQTDFGYESNDGHDHQLLVINLSSLQLAIVECS